MTNKTLDDKIRAAFGEFAVDKGLIRRMGVAGDDRHVPSYVMDWIVTYTAKTQKTTSSLERAVQEFIAKHLPAKGEKERIRFKLAQGEVLTVLDAVSVTVKLGREIRYLASIPCLDENKASIDQALLVQNEALLQGSTWGAAKICYDASDEGGGVRIIDFKPMQAGRVSLEAFCEARRAFTDDEWINLIVRTLGYEPARYGEKEKSWLLCRLIPIVHNRINMMELAPPGSGKSYVYNNVSRHVLSTTGDISPAVLFYNRQSKTPGVLTRFDLLVLDEAQSIHFSKADEIQAQLKGYLEQGVYTRGDCCATAECGLMLLANIDLKQHPNRRYHSGKPVFVPARDDFIRRLPETFLESPLIDRFHGIIPGWEIPPFETDQQAVGLGLKADYFAEVCHTLRSASHLSQGVRSKLGLSGGKRDCTAIERMACGLAKLLLINPDNPRFEELVIRPAEELRRLVRTQLHALDAQGYAPELQIKRFSVVSPAETGLGRIGKYDLLEEIGKGGMACVYRAMDTGTGTVVAVKKVRTEGASLDEAAIRREMDIYGRLRQIASPHILVVLDILREAGEYALVTEYADGGSLWDLLGGEEATEETRKPLDEKSARAIAGDMLAGLAALHEHGIVHRDIKPQNILRCDDLWKIADFGISKLMNNPVTGYTFQGAFTAPWAPPEQITGAPAHPSADVYAWARVVGYMLTGRTSVEKTLSVEPAWRELLGPCIDFHAENRPAVAKLRGELDRLPG